MPTTDAPLCDLPGAWAQALYGPSGFYRQASGPAGHFATSAQGLPGVDELLADLVAAVAAAHHLEKIIEIGCGRGELLKLLRERAPHLRLLGVDVVPRPSSLAPGIDWLVSPGAERLPEQLTDLRGALVFAHEWLDVVPCDIAVRTDAGFRLLAVDGDGDLVPDRPLDDAQDAWVRAHWPDGEVVEIGLRRDAAYRDLRSRLSDGLLVCVDYAHTADDRPEGGTFVGYRAGAVCAPRFDGSTDLTAHVAIDSLGADRLLRQHEVADEFLDRPARPDHACAGTDPSGYVAALRARAAWTALTAPGGLGDFRWSFDRVAPVTSSDAAS